MKWVMSRSMEEMLFETTFVLRMYGWKMSIEKYSIMFQM